MPCTISHMVSWVHILAHVTYCECLIVTPSRQCNLSEQLNVECQNDHIPNTCAKTCTEGDSAKLKLVFHRL